MKDSEPYGIVTLLLHIEGKMIACINNFANGKSKGERVIVVRGVLLVPR